MLLRANSSLVQNNQKQACGKYVLIPFGQMAQNIGDGWHITNMAAESANQMLQMVEFGQMNGQLALEAGIVNLSGTSSVNGASITGSTSALGNNSGAAEKTINLFFPNE